MIVLAIVFLQVTAIGGIVALRLLVPPEVAKIVQINVTTTREPY